MRERERDREGERETETTGYEASREAQTVVAREGGGVQSARGGGGDLIVTCCLSLTLSLHTFRETQLRPQSRVKSSCLVLDLYRGSPESGGLWYESRELKKTI